MRQTAREKSLQVKSNKKILRSLKTLPLKETVLSNQNRIHQIDLIKFPHKNFVKIQKYLE